MIDEIIGSTGIVTAVANIPDPRHHQIVLHLTKEGIIVAAIIRAVSRHVTTAAIPLLNQRNAIDITRIREERAAPGLDHPRLKKAAVDHRRKLLKEVLRNKHEFEQ